MLISKVHNTWAGTAREETECARVAWTCWGPRGSRVKAENLTLWNRAGAEARRSHRDEKDPGCGRAADEPERQATECGLYRSERPRRHYPVLYCAVQCNAGLGEMMDLHIGMVLPGHRSHNLSGGTKAMFLRTQNGTSWDRLWSTQRTAKSLPDALATHAY